MKMRYSFILFMALLLVFSFQTSYAQVVYGSNQYIDAGNPGGLNTDSPSSTTGWTSFTTGTQSTNSWSAPQAIPFSFEFFGTPVTHFMVSQNMVLTFDTTVTALPGANTNLPSDSLPDMSIANYWDEFTDSPPTGSNDEVYTKVFGTAPNRQLWIKWYSFEYGNPNTSFQYSSIVLEETTNSIYLVDMYGNTQGLTTTAGLQENASTAFQFGDSLLALGGNGSTNSDNDYIEFVVLAGNDAGVASIDTPATPYCGSSGLWVTIANYGSATLTSATVNWSLNGVAQTPYSWTGSLPSGGTDGPVMIASTSFVEADSIVAWTSNPNGGVDGNTTNDTSSTVVKMGLAAGTYTIGGIGADYATFTDAANALNSLGICGPVTFNVDAASGPYIEQIELGEITGTSATNTITFNGNGATLRYGSGDTDNRHVVRLNGADYVTFNNMVIEVDTDSTYGWGVHLINAADHNTFNNVTVLGDTVGTSSSSNDMGILASGSNTSATTAGNNANYLTIDNCTVIGGYYAIRLNGNTSDAMNNTIINSTIQDAYTYSIYLDDNNGALISGNDISRPNRVSVSTFYGTYLTSGNVNCTIEKNYYHNTHGSASSLTGSTYCIYFSSCDAPVGQENVAKNNVIYDLNSDGTIYAIYNSGSDGAYYYNNTISLDYAAATGGTTRGFYQTTTADNVDFRNNVLTVTRGGTGTKHALYFSTSTSTITSDNNAIYVNPDVTFGRYGTTDYATYTDWRTANGGAYDALSVNADPVYVDLAGGDLTPTSGAVNDIGASLAEVTEDILGNPRPSTPDPGAYEFAPSATDVAVTQLINLPSHVLPNTVVNFDIEVSNIGADSVSADTVDFFLNGVLTSSHGYTALAPVESDTVSASFTASASGTDVITAALRKVTGDGNASNDTLTANLTIETVFATPFFENFEGLDPTVSDTIPGGWTNETDDNFDWEADNGGTPSLDTGPDLDHTTSSDTGIYMYTEATGPSSGDVAHLTTPPLDLTGLSVPTLQFWYHMYGAAMGELHVDVWSGGVWTNDVMPPLVGEQQTSETDPWRSAIVDLSTFSGIIKVRFRGIIGTSFTSDMAIDDVSIGEPSPDLAVTNLIAFPASPPPNTTLDVNVEVSNVGGATAGATNLDVYLNGVFSSSASVAALGIGEADTVTASITTSASGTDTLTAALQMVAGDPNPLNDTLTTTYDVAVPFAAPYFQDFEGLDPSVSDTIPGGWVNETNDDFDWEADDDGTTSSGTGPSVDHTTSSDSGVYMYTESSTPNYPFKTANLTTPLIDLSGLTNPAAAFWFHMYGEAMGELHLDVWSAATGWVNDARSPLVGQYQTSETDPWLNAGIDLAPFAGNSIRIRFRGITGASFTSDMAIDDFSVQEMDSLNFPFEIQARSVDMPLLTQMPLTQTGIVSNVNFQGTFSNPGPENTGDLNVAVQNGGTVFSNSITGVTIPAFMDSTFSLGQWDASSTAAGMYNIFMYSSNFTGTNDTVVAPLELGSTMGWDYGNHTNSIAYSATLENWIGSRFTLTDPDTLTSISMLITNSVFEGDSFSVDLYTSVNDTPGVAFARLFRGTFGDVSPLPALATFYIPAGMPMPAGDFYAVLDMDEPSISSYPIGADNTGPGSVKIPRRFAFKGGTSDWIYFEDAGNPVFQTFIPIIRAGFQESDAHDYAVKSVDAQANMVPGEAYTVTAEVLNFGNQAETNVTVELREDGTFVADDVVSLAPGGRGMATFSYTPSDSGVFELSVVSLLSNDLNPANDSAFAFVRVLEAGSEIVFFDDFEDTLFTQANWVIVDDPLSIGTWRVYTVPYPNAYTLPVTSSGNVAAADADEETDSTITTAMLPLDLSGHDEVHLDFDSDWNAIADDDTARVNVSNDSGATWTTLIEWPGPNDVRNTHISLDLTPYLANSSNAIIAFESYQPGFDWWWTIDNVCVSSVGVTPPTYVQSFEGTFPPQSWSKLNPDGGTGWDTVAVGTSPVPGWTGGIVTGPTGGGNAVAFCTWFTGGASSNDQYLVTPRMVNVQSDNYINFSLRYWPDTYDDTLDVVISTTTPNDPANFNILVDRLGFGAGSDTNWVDYSYDLTNYVNPGDNIYVGLREHVQDNLNNGASFSFDLFATNAVVDTGQIAPSAEKLLLTEIVVTPTGGEFIEIYNPNQTSVDLSNYYITDATFAGDSTYYYKIVQGGGGGGSFGDFHARFPDGATIQASEYQTIALPGDSSFYAEYGVMPTYELFEDGHANPSDAPDMREAFPGSINNQGGLTNSDEVVILYNWDGMSDLVTDVDYLLYNSGSPVANNEAVDKTGIVIDGPDADTLGSAYLPDTPIANQRSALNHDFGFSVHRIDFSEGSQVMSGGNGVNGSDETSENLDSTFTNNSIPSPNGPYQSPAFQFFDDFESYTAGTQLTLQTSEWTTWSGTPGTAEDPAVSNAQAYSGSNSVVIVENNDLVKTFGSNPITSGKWKLSWQMYIPSGKAGYFNTLAEFNSSSPVFAMQVYFDVGGTGRLDAGGASAATFNYPYDTWQSVEVFVDLDSDSAHLVLGGSLIYSWQYTLGTFGNGIPLELNANDFFGATADDEMYFDDYSVTQDSLVVGIEDVNEIQIPTQFALHQNYPNPFNPTTTIKYQLPRSSDVSVVIYNMLGQKVRTLVNSRKEAGYYEVEWNGLNDHGVQVATGLYIYRFQAADFVKSRKMLLLK